MMLCAHLAVFAVALSTARAVMSSLKIDRRFLNTGIMLLSLMGAYALRANLIDCWVALAFGVIGVGMRRTGFPAAPFLLALILGSMAETNLRRALVLGGGSYAFVVQRPVALILLLLRSSSWRLRYGDIARAGRSRSPHKSVAGKNRSPREQRAIFYF